MRTFTRLSLVLAIAAVLVILSVPMQVQATNDRRQPDIDHPGWIYYQRGLYFQTLGNHGIAIGNFSTAIRYQPEMVEAYEARADSYVALEEYEPAIADYTQALALKPGDGLLYAKRAFAYAACGDLDQGRQDFEKIAQSGLVI